MTIIQKIAEAGCGCDDAAKDLISIDEALSLITGATAPVKDTEIVATGSAKARKAALGLLRYAVPGSVSVANDTAESG